MDESARSISKAQISNVSFFLEGVPICDKEWLRLTVYELPALAIHPQTGAGKLEELFGLQEVVHAREVSRLQFATPTPVTQVTCVVSHDTPLRIVVDRNPDSESILSDVGIATIVTSRFLVGPNERKEIHIDASLLPQVTCQLQGEAAKASKVVVFSREWKGIQRQYGRFHVTPKNGAIRLIGLEPARYVFVANAAATARDTTLVDVSTDLSYVDVRETGLINLKWPDQALGEFCMVQGAQPVPVEFSYGFSARNMNQMALRHEPVSLVDLNLSGVQRVFFRTGISGLFCRELAELRQEKGKIPVEIPVENGGIVEFVVGNDSSNGVSWSIIGRSTSSSVDGLKPSRGASRWIIDGIPAGRYSFSWVYSAGARPEVPIVRDAVIETGKHYVFDTVIPQLRSATVLVVNWETIPETNKPDRLWVDGTETRYRGDSGAFVAELSEPLDQYREITFGCRQVGGIIRSQELSIGAGGLEVRFPDVHATQIIAGELFGGILQLSYYRKPTQMRFPQLWLPTTVDRQPDGNFYVDAPADPGVLCVMMERDAGSKDSALRGVFVVKPGTERLEPDLSGRWVDVECTASGPTIVSGLMFWQGERIELPLSILASGWGRFWLPLSISRVRFSGDGGTVEREADGIPSMIRL